MNDQTVENFKAAFAGESMARNKYTFYAEVAREEGYPQIAEVFEETAHNEKAHAQVHFKMLDGIGDTRSNLKAAYDGETYEYTKMYPEFAQQAEAAGDRQAAALFKLVANVEKRHAARFNELLELLESGQINKKSEKVKWICPVCGHIHEGTEPPKICPLCKTEGKNFELFCECF